MTSSVTGRNRRLGHSAHLMRGFSQTPRTHSLAQAGAYPDRPVLRLSNRRGYTSSRPRKSDRNRAIFAADDDVRSTDLEITSMRSMSCSATRSRPVFPLEALHARELLRVRGHKCRAASSGLAGEKDIIGADRPTLGFELGANSARGARIVFVEESPLEWAAQERLEPLSVTVLPLALRNAVPQLECNDRRQQDHALASHCSLKSPTHVDFGAVDQRDARVRIKQVRRHSNTSRTGVGGC
jgi:hypothetical protein